MCLFKKKSSNIKDYLAIRWFSRQHLLIGVMWLLILNVLINAVTVWLDREPMLFMDGLAQSAQPLWLLVIAMVIFAPVYEEVMFRGFLWTGLASSRLGVWGASLISSLVFALIHLQYGVVEWVGVFCLARLRWADLTSKETKNECCRVGLPSHHHYVFKDRFRLTN